MAQPYVEPAGETFEPDFPERADVLAEQNRNEPIPFEDTNENNINIVNMPYTDENKDRKSTRLNSSHLDLSRMPSSA